MFPAKASVDIDQSGLLLAETSPGVVTPCGPGDTPLAVAASTALAGTQVTNYDLASDVFALVAAEAISYGEYVEAAAGGRVRVFSSGTFVGRAIASASTAGQGIRVAVTIGAGTGAVGGGGVEILSSPAQTEVFEGQTATFALVLSGTATYQWQSSPDGLAWSDIPGATSNSYSIANTVRATHDGGYYRCVYTVNGASHNSSEALLMVWSPAALGPYLWFNETSPRFVERTAATTPSVDGGPIGTLRDISGSNRHFTAPTDAARPLHVAAALNGRAVIRFQGTDDVLQHTAASAWPFLHNGTPHVIAALVKAGTVADPNALQVICGTRSGGSGSPGMYLGHDTRDGVGDNRLLHSISTGTASTLTHATSPNSCAANAWNVVLLSASPGSDILPERSRIFVNTSEAYAYNAVDASMAGTNNTQPLRIGAGINVATTATEFPLTGDLLEFVIVSGTVSDADLFKLRDYLIYKGGLTPAARVEVGIPSSDVNYRNLSAGLVLTHNAPTAHPGNPIYDNTGKPLDPGNDLFLPSVYLDGGQYVCLYKSSNFVDNQYVCRLVSADGITFVEELVGLVTVGGNTTNNVVMELMGGLSVFPVQVGGKWVAMGDDSQGVDPSVEIYDSSDGLAWALANDLSTIPGEYSEGRSIIRLQDNRWAVAYIRGHTPSNDREIGFLLGPIDGLYTGTWTDLGPTVLTASSADQKYNQGFEKHGRGWLMASAAYEGATNFTTTGDLWWMDDFGKITKLVDNAMPLGATGTWNDEWVSPSCVITVGNETRIYGWGADEDHQTAPPRHAKLALWTIGKRRWSQVSGTGVLETPALRANAAVLTVNSNAVGGSIKVEVIDNATGLVMTGLDASESTVVEANAFAAPVTWGAAVLPVDRAIRLRFIVNNATLYSWTAGTEA